MSNYPPGVSGNEWQIAGPEFERDEWRECPREGSIMFRTVSTVAESRIRAAIDNLRGNPESTAVAIVYLQTALSDIEEVVDLDACVFQGDVTVQGFDGIVSWECPVCRVTHEETQEEEY